MVLNMMVKNNNKFEWNQGFLLLIQTGNENNHCNCLERYDFEETFLRHRFSLYKYLLWHFLDALDEIMCREPGRHSTLDKGHEEGGLAYANAGSSLRSPPGYSRSSSPQKKPESAYFLLVLSPKPLTLRGALPHYLSLKKELAYSSS